MIKKDYYKALEDGTSTVKITKKEDDTYPY